MRRIRPLSFVVLPRAVAALVALGSIACAPEPPLVPGTRELPIVDGTRELGEESVVFVRAVFGACTGTLITDRVVLTAKHCVQLRGEEEPFPASFFQIGVGDSMRSTTSYAVREVLTTPGGFFGSAITDGTDIALLVLREPVPGVTPIGVRREPPDTLTGREVTAIGFGQTPAGETGIKYRTTTTIDAMNGSVLFGTNAICQGDSGGPLILEADGTTPRQVVGVAAYGQTMAGGPSCPAVLDAWNRVDVQIDLIERAILRSGACLARGEEVCNSLDDDCNGTIDEGCAELGEACETDADCRFAPLPEALRDGTPPGVVCGEVAGSRRCALPCDPLSPTGACGAIDVPFTTDDVALEGFYCARAGGAGSCEGLCARGTAGAGLDATPCAADTDCASLFCASEVGLCATPCLGGAATCPSDEVCTAGATQCGLCAAPSARPTGRALGEPCASASECGSGACGVLDGRSICTAPCTDDAPCGEGMRCGPDGWCVRGDRGGLYGACGADEDCTGTASCLELEGRRYCAAPCTSDFACGAGTCTAYEDEMRCVPDDPLLGAPCTDRCTEGACIEGTCTALCGGELLCPIGHDCVREGALTVCRPRAAGGGCSVSGWSVGGQRAGSIGLGAWLAIAISIVSARWRRSRTRRRHACGTSAPRPRAPSRPRA